jgi:hypothetical protein
MTPDTPNIAGEPFRCPKCRHYHASGTDCIGPVMLPASLKETFPVTLYFATEQDAEDFKREILAENPNLKLQ